jgi:hypothetical protein
MTYSRIYSRRDAKAQRKEEKKEKREKVQLVGVP